MAERSADDARPWFASFGGTEGDGPRLYCFPYAGGGARAFRTWPARLPADVGVVGVRLPGREDRAGEAAYRTWPDLLDALAAALAGDVGDRPYVLFGHSLGARLAYEVTHRLVAAGVRPPDRLVVSACRAPRTPPRWPPIHDLDRDGLRDRLRALDGISGDVLESDAVFAIFEAVLRADLKLADTWEPTLDPLAVPVATFCGAEDAVAPCEDMTDWSAQTTGALSRFVFPGGHFFLRSEEAAVVDTLARLLNADAPIET